MAILYTVYVPHIGAYLPEVDYDYISKKSIDYGYISIIERIGSIASVKDLKPKKSTIQEFLQILSNLGFEAVRINQKKINNIVCSRAVIIDKDDFTALVIFEKVSYN